MPPVSRRLPLARRGWTIAHVYTALRGQWFFRTDRIDPHDVRALWRAYGRELVAWWITSSPGSRPWAWWQWDAPEPLDDAGEEEQHAYLTRHRLWMPGEKGRWQAGEARRWTLNDLRSWWAERNGT